MADKQNQKAVEGELTDDELRMVMGGAGFPITQGALQGAAGGAGSPPPHGIELRMAAAWDAYTRS
jgi:hypothetical protein